MNDLKYGAIEPRRPIRVGWVWTEAGSEGRSETWLHSETGLVAISMVIGNGAGDGDTRYCLRLNRREGERWGGALVLLALADFDMLEATEDRSPRRGERVFQLPAG